MLTSKRRRAAKTFERIEALSRKNREHRNPDLEREILGLRHEAGIRLLDEAKGNAIFAEPDPDGRTTDGEPPEIAPGRLTAGLLRAAILEHGCLLIRNLISAEEAGELAADIDRAIEARNSGNGGGGYYEEFEADPRFEAPERPWIAEAGGVLVGDSPKLMVRTLDLFEREGLREILTSYLGERPAVTLQKSTLRKASPGIPGGWHQDGRFLGPVRAMNIWLSLSRCGDEAPGLDLVPRRLDELVPTGTEGTYLETEISAAVAAEAASETGVLRPIFEPGDALLFDELFLHKTGSDPSMKRDRYAIESWFFGPSGFPGAYAPFAF